MQIKKIMLNRQTMAEMNTIKMTSKKMTLCRWLNHNPLLVMPQLDQRNKEVQYRINELMTLQ